MNFAGTVSISSELLISLVVEVTESLVKHGFGSVSFSTGTAATPHPCKLPVERCSRGANGASPWSLSMHAIMKSRSPPREPKLARYLAREMTGHGGLIETSLVLAIDPTLVDLEKAELRPVDTALAIEDDVVTEPYIIEEKSETGVFGDLQGVSVANGEEMWKLGAEQVARNIHSALARRGKKNVGVKEPNATVHPQVP